MSPTEKKFEKKFFVQNLSSVPEIKVFVPNERPGKSSKKPVNY